MNLMVIILSNNTVDKKKEPNYDENMTLRPRLIDIGCGLGGVSDGFAKEGFAVLGIDIEDMPMKGYKHLFKKADIRNLKVSDLPIAFQNPNVIWGSLPCRDFSPLARCYGKNWKNPPTPQRGLELILAFFNFVSIAKPNFWIMENVYNLTKYLPLKPQIQKYIRHKKHAFWGDFPPFLFPRIMGLPITKGQYVNGVRCPQPRNRQGSCKLESWYHAKIPIECSQVFARACKEALLDVVGKSVSTQEATP